ncbi:MAG: CCA tRNA nucleotidyltransferase [Hyphomicrobiaceae bacterium]
MNPTTPPSSPSRAPSLAGGEWLEKASTQRVLSVLEAAGFSSRVVGGAIRNAILGRPVRDLDIATVARPKEILSIAAKADLKAIPTGLAHGTVTIVSDGEPIEVTTLRTDVEAHGRHATVAFTSDWVADAQRRDFTMNAIYCDASGVIFDPVGGYEDALSGRVRFIGDPDARIREDYLRILRFFRIFAEYADEDIDAFGRDACIRERCGLRALSAERIQQELTKLLVAPRAYDAVCLLVDYGLMGEILPAVPHLARYERLLKVAVPATSAVRLGMLTLEGKDDVERIADRLKLSKRCRKEMDIVARALGAKSSPSLLDAKRWLYEHGEAGFAIWIAVAQARSPIAKIDTDWETINALPNAWSPPVFPLTGADALALGAREGPSVGQALREIEEMWIASDFAMPEPELRAALAAKLNNRSQGTEVSAGLLN